MTTQLAVLSILTKKDHNHANGGKEIQRRTEEVNHNLERGSQLRRDQRDG